MVKKSKKIIFTILVIIIIVGLSFGIKIIATNINIKNTEEKISKIDTNELHDKIKNELSKTQLNIKDKDIKTEMIEQVNGYLALVYKDNQNNVISIPCYRIASKKDDKKLVFIQYIDSRDPIGKVVTETIEKVLKENYDINLNGNKKYNARFKYLYGDMAEVYTNDDTFWSDVYKKLTGKELYNNKKQFYTEAFGIDFEVSKQPLLNLDT